MTGVLRHLRGQDVASSCCRVSAESERAPCPGGPASGAPGMAMAAAAAAVVAVEAVAAAAAVAAARPGLPAPAISDWERLRRGP